MSETNQERWIHRGVCRAQVAVRLRDDPVFMQALVDLDARLHDDALNAPAMLQPGAMRVTLGSTLGPLDAWVKRFSAGNAFTRLWGNRLGSRALRCFQVAEHLRRHGVGTPEPIACLEHGVNRHRGAGCYLATCLDGWVSLTEQLVALYHDDPDCTKLMTLLQVTADAVRKLHEAGIQHGDLGNQNILLKRDGPGNWSAVSFIDLSRANCRGTLSLEDRGRDISRLSLPSDFLRIFKDMYWAGIRPPEAFDRAERRHRRRYRRHDRTRSWRHPLRERARAQERAGRRVYPEPRDIWIWDERSGQPVITLRPEDRRRLYPAARAVQLVAAGVKAAFPLWRAYRALRAQCFNLPVPLESRIALCVEPMSGNLDRQFSLLRPLGAIPIMVRFYRHEGVTGIVRRTEAVRMLHIRGHPVTIAFVQDRRGVRDPACWKEFVEQVLSANAPRIEWVELGHAINRVKWGIWEYGEYQRLVESARSLLAHYPAVRVMGPAVIDFDPVSALAALRAVRKSRLRLAACSAHLYVDRRGAPENRQAGFDLIDKCALMRAVGRVSGICDEGLILSEFNWPLAGTGVYSPVGAPYESPGPHVNQPSVDEDTAAAYLLRYHALALASGMVDRVYWWRLTAHGYGLVDDRTDPWRVRPSYAALCVLLDILGQAMFVSRIQAPTGVWLLWFERPDGSPVCLAWSAAGRIRHRLPFDCQEIRTMFGQRLPMIGRDLELDGNPVYCEIRRDQ